MPAAELRARTQTERTPPQGAERMLSGWGRTARSRCRVITPHGVDDILQALALAAGNGLIARGAGRSYGDAAQNGGGDVLDMTGLDRILSIDAERGLITAQAGATVAQLMARLAAHGLTLPVLPGTRHVTLAGAIASDIHGKNHHRDGAFARHVAELSLCTPAHGLIEVSPDTDPDLFYATLGGMGLTGVIVGATLRVEPLPSPWVAADVDRTDGLTQTLELMSGAERRRYSVAWLDLLAEGPKMGRAIVSRADPLVPAGEALPPARGGLRRRRATSGRDGEGGGASGSRGSAYPGALSKRPMLEVPNGFPGALLRPASMRIFNALRWRATPRRERERPLALVPYFFPLDVLGEWNRLYGPAGLIQYQFVIPSGEERTLERGFGKQAGRFVEELLQDHGVSIHGEDELERFEGEGNVAKVVTRAGLEIEADAVVIGAGVAPDTGLAQRAGLEIGEKGGVRCSSRLESSATDVWAAGDICEYESVLHGEHVRIEHWDVAFNHGKTAALNMLGKDVAHEVAPYFYSVLGDWGELEYVGPAKDWDEEILRGSYDDGEFTTWYLKDGQVKAALTFGRSDDLDHARRLLTEKPVLDASQRAALGDVDSDLSA